MLTFIIRRLVQTIPVLLGVTIITFSLVHLIPGDPAQILAGEAASGDQVEQMRERLGLNDSLPTQYFSYLKDVVTLDFGNSIRNGRAVGDEIGARFWVTVELALYSTIFSIFLGMLAGIISATKRYSFADTGIMIIALFGLSMPNFWMGLMLIQYFSINLGWFASSGWGTFSQMVLPVLTLGTTGAAIIARMTRSSMLEVIGQDYIRTARAKGVKERYVIYQHALKNAMIPVVTVVGLQFGSLLGGTVLAESVFAINGMGRLIIDSIRARDFPIVQGTVLVVSLLFVIVNLLVDVAYKLLNKRVDVD
ncbi:ABC transporter permease [Alkalicoccobacillus murimartini]|uniref:Peptide/nickel transport system permease protein n=1 Tax=Alkalicoccobacillus murimartini TaxID=171685 RepID=A0ABT9YN82_9BACI|nr:ABC transporter permease [Alkalicoccobacillus murimartini]MDQ0209332.1 peptide/nickel transport system permease protein [Alkalicoccobacillus murimartini]